MKLYVFNPGTDMALADYNENYMPPASARVMAHDLAILPAWYAAPGSAVLAPSAYNAEYLEKMMTMFPLSAQLITEPELPDYAEAQVVPWGWNPAFRKRMLKGGIAPQVLPTPDSLLEYRNLASRFQVLALERCFSSHEDYICGRHHLINRDGSPTPEEIAKMYEEGCVFKSLWSGSGKGLRWCSNGLMKTTADWCDRELRLHGAVIAEPVYDKVADFAMEFCSDGQGKILFTGYSRFDTDEKGTYRGNILMPDEEVEQWIQQYVPRQAVAGIRDILMQNMELLYGKSYAGPLGIDMMICRQNGAFPYAIHPHVEVNLRMTMGIVSHRLYQNYVSCGSRGIFSIDYSPSGDSLLQQHENDLNDYPLVVNEGRIVSGYLSLAPVTSKSHYRAYMRLEPK